MNQDTKILIVDDEKLNRVLITEILSKLSYTSISVEDGYKALEIIDDSFDLVLLDVMLPGINGFEVARRIREIPIINDIPIIMVTALSDKQDRLLAVEVGANDFITKPIDFYELKLRTQSILRMKSAQDKIKQWNEELEKKVKEKTEDLLYALGQMEIEKQNTYKAHLETIRHLAIAAEFKDKNTFMHIERMSHYCAEIARTLNLDENETELILRASPMHDVGKLGIPDAILTKPGKLTFAERKTINLHTLYGSRILSDSSSDLVRAGEIFARTHHERWNGTGYPLGLTGEETPLWGRIAAVADVFDALISVRPYKDSYTNEEAFEYIESEQEILFDPMVVDAFFSSKDSIIDIQSHYPNQDFNLQFSSQNQTSLQ